MISLVKRIFGIVFGAALVLQLAPAVQAQEEPATTEAEEEDTGPSLDELLEQVRQGISTQTREFQQREAEFRAARDRQQSLLNQARQTQAAEERRSERLEATFQANERQIITLTEQLRDKLGNLQEVFGVLQQVAGDTRSLFQGSYISLQYPNRDENLNILIQKAAEGTDLPTIEEIEGLWFEMQREMTEAGKIAEFETAVTKPDGEQVTVPMTRVGAFNIVSDGNYYIMQGTKAAELPKQPPGRFTGTIDDLIGADPGETVSFALDPSRGQLLSIYVETPGLMERVNQGGIIGYITITLGVIAILFVIERFLFLFRTGGKVRAQMREKAPSLDNPLGRVLQVYQENKRADVETLELKLDEAILKETPKLERFLTLIKLISAVAPLLGLLGTVTGMIETFQAITLFGTGDPKLMAGGISQALVTTVLGLTVAIPTLLLHSMVAGMSRRIIHVLEEQSAGIIAVHAEKD